ncbi:MAG: lipopolysaccharide heptosyltransferase I [Betaproteobacteria bacterium]|nr:lipopolysaccharide heptosyltransferase I [Betaproteobacteria bacterium]
MLSILLIKTSSLGDVVHNLPVVGDIRGASPDITIDWVVERSFSAIPALHPGVRTVIPCELRRWRRSWLTRATRREWGEFVTRLRSTRYDAIIDTQGLLKSALIARFAYGTRYGLDWESSREPLRLFYDKTFNVPWGQHAVARNRELTALALGYEPQGEPDYGMRCMPSTAAWLPSKPYVVLLHATSHSRKLWPEPSWVGLGVPLAARGYSLLLPWGAEEEHARAKRLAVAIPSACVAPALGLAELAAVLSGAAAAIGVDTGLTHLAAALGVPVVGIYGATDPKATGVCAATPAANLGGQGRFPSVDEVIGALEALGALHRDPGVRQP